jgi:hypothetical protein
METPDDLDRWARRGLITPDQRTAIESFEQSHPSKSPAIAGYELLVYVGVAAVFGALFGVVGPLPPIARALLLSILALAAGAAGELLLERESAPSSRAAGVLWFLSVAFIAEAGASISGSGHRGVIKPLLLSGTPAFAFALFYWSAKRAGAQLVAVYGTGLLVVFGLANVVVGVNGTTAGLLLVAVGAAGLAMAGRGIVEPIAVAHELFGFSLTVGFFAASFQPHGSWAELMAIASACFLLRLSLRRRSVELVSVGAISLSILAATSVGRHFERALGVPTLMLIAGAALIGAAVLRGQLRPYANGDR